MFFMDINTFRRFLMFYPYQNSQIVSFVMHYHNIPWNIILLKDFHPPGVKNKELCYYFIESDIIEDILIAYHVFFTVTIHLGLPL